jgi:hypothetical protein
MNILLNLDLVAALRCCKMGGASSSFLDNSKDGFGLLWQSKCSEAYLDREKEKDYSCMSIGRSDDE